MPTQNNEFNQYVNAYNTARNDTVSTKYFNIGCRIRRFYAENDTLFGNLSN